MKKQILTTFVCCPTLAEKSVAHSIIYSKNSTNGPLLCSASPFGNCEIGSYSPPLHVLPRSPHSYPCVADRVEVLWRFTPIVADLRCYNKCKAQAQLAKNLPKRQHRSSACRTVEKKPLWPKINLVCIAIVLNQGPSSWRGACGLCKRVWGPSQAPQEQLLPSGAQFFPRLRVNRRLYKSFRELLPQMDPLPPDLQLSRWKIRFNKMMRQKEVSNSQSMRLEHALRTSFESPFVSI